MTSPRTTYLVVPAFSDQAGQLRIVSRRASCPLTLADYRHAPDLWAEAGLVNAQGHVVSLAAPSRVLDELRDCEPIRGVLTVYDRDQVAA